MNRLVTANKILPIIIFLVMNTACAALTISDSIEITVEPQEFDVRHQLPKKDWPEPTGNRTEFHFSTVSPIFPNFPSVTVENGELQSPFGVNVNLPHKIKIEVPSKCINEFSWKKVQIPVIMAVSFGTAMQETGISMSFVQKNSNVIQKISSNPEAWEGQFPPGRFDFDNPDNPYFSPSPPTNSGRIDYWNMTYFTDLPKCSVTYDFSVTVRGIESKAKPFSIEFYVDGEKITQENFDKMAIKYPALKLDTWTNVPNVLGN